MINLFNENEQKDNVDNEQNTDVDNKDEKSKDNVDNEQDVKVEQKEDNVTREESISDNNDNVENIQEEEEIENKTDEVVIKSEEEIEELASKENTNNATQEIVEEKKVENVETNDKEISQSNTSKTTSQTFQPIAKEFLPENFNPFARTTNLRFQKPKSDIEEKVLEIKRVIKTTKGGRRFKFSALVVVGDKKDKVGYAVGKHIEIPEAIKKAVRLAKKNMYRINVVGEQQTIPHEIIGHHGAAKILLKPAVEGKGVIASDTIRAVVELGGIRNIYSKNLGSNNKHNVVHATIKALATTKTKAALDELKKPIPRRPIPELTKTEKLIKPGEK